MRRLPLLLVFVAVCCAVVVGAAWHARKSRTASIGLVVTSIDNPYFVEMIDGAKKAATDDPAFELSVQAPERGAIDPERQLQIVENLISGHASAVLVVPADSKQIVKGVLEANEAKIPFIDLDNEVDQSLAASRQAKIASFIGSNSRNGGKLAGNYVKSRLGPAGGEIAILEGVPGVEAAMDRKAGFLEAIANDAKLHVVASQAADWDREKAYNVTKGILAAHPGLAAIFGANDEMALGAAKALDEAAKKNVVVVGYDATPDGRAAVKKGALSATVAQDPSAVGRLGVEYAKRVIAGERVPEHTEVPLKLITAEPAAK